MNKLLSVIIPIYNSEKYLIKCLDSIKQQTYTNMEILMIDDGSTDKSADICKHYCTIDNRFKYFYQENGGVSSARNNGIIKSIGDFLTFVDSDDWLDDNMYSVLLKELKESDADVVICDEIETNGKEYNHCTFSDIEEGTYYKDSIDRYVLNRFTGAVWKCIYRRELFQKSVLFPIGIPLTEDKLFCLNIIGNSRSIHYLKKGLYYRFLRNDSASQIFRENQKEIQIKVYENMKDIIDKKWSKDHMYIAYFYLTSNVKMVLMSILNNDKRTHLDKYKEMKEFCELPVVKEAICESNISSKLIRAIKREHYFICYLYLYMQILHSRG